MPRKKKEEKPTVLSAADEINGVLEQTDESAPVSVKLNSSAIKNTDFDIFAAHDLLNKANAVDGFKSMSEVAASYLPVPWMAMQYVIGRVGVPARSITEFIGQDNIGKSSLILTLLGVFTMNNMPCLYINTEMKRFDDDWKVRLFNSNPEVGEKINSVIEFEWTESLDGVDACINKFVRRKRDVEGVPKDVPIVIAVDSISKAMNSEEKKAAGVGVDSAKKQKDVGVAAISQKPGVTAKWHHNWVRLLGPLLIRDNVTILLTSAQNQDMDTSQSPFIPKSYYEKQNRTRPGGNALNQAAAVQFTMTERSRIKVGEEVVGKSICLYGVKNGCGPSSREITYNILFNSMSMLKTKDVPGKYLAPAVDMDAALCNLLVKEGVFGLTLSGEKYTSEELEVYKAKASTVVREINASPANILKVAKALGIQGYEETTA